MYTIKKDYMKSHELATFLLTNPDMPVITLSDNISPQQYGNVGVAFGEKSVFNNKTIMIGSETQLSRVNASPAIFPRIEEKKDSPIVNTKKINEYIIITCPNGYSIVEDILNTFPENGDLFWKDNQWHPYIEFKSSNFNFSTWCKPIKQIK